MSTPENELETATTATTIAEPSDRSVSNVALEERLISLQADVKAMFRFLQEKSCCGLIVQHGASDQTQPVSRHSSRSRRTAEAQQRQKVFKLLDQPEIHSDDETYSKPEVNFQTNFRRFSSNSALTSRTSTTGSPGSSVKYRARTVAYLGQGTEHPFLERVVSSSSFEAFIGLCIVVNAILIGVQTNLEADARTVHYPNAEAFQVVDMFFNAIFLVEILLRIAAKRWEFFCGAGVGWNYLDLAIVFSSLLEIISTVMSAIDFAQFRVLRLVRISKLMRVIRITRIVRSIRALRMMVNQLLFTLRSLIWALVLLVIIVYVFAILMTQAFAGYMEEHKDHLHNDDACKLWSSIPRSMLTLFQSVTGGVNWNVVLDPLGDFGWFAPGLFIVYICFIEFAVLNVLTGVFCQTAIESAGYDQELVAQNMLENKNVFIQKVKAIFQDLDLDGSGNLSADELQERLKDPKVQAYFQSLDLDLSDVSAVLTLMELEPADLVCVEEFVDGCLKLKGAATNLNIAKLSKGQDHLRQRLQVVTELVEECIDLNDPFLQSPGSPLQGPVSPVYGEDFVPGFSPRSGDLGRLLSHPPPPKSLIV